MSNEDLEKDMEQKKQETSGNQEFVNKSSASEGKLLDTSNDPASVENISGTGEEVKLDASGGIVSEDSQDGSGPDPESMSQWESNDSGDKMAG